MARIANKITDLIGGTPLLEVPIPNNNWHLLLKLEKFNPGQSMKDRMALSMIEDAERRGVLRPSGTIIESSSGNTATGLALIAASKGYRFIAVVDHHTSPEKIGIIRAYGGEVIIVGDGMPEDRVAVHAREQKAAELALQISGAVFLNQADNPANPAGYIALAEELRRGIGEVAVLIGSIGTGGSLCGTARALKKKSPDTEVIAVEPKGSVIFGGQDGPYLQSGTGNPGSVEIADNVDKGLIDRNLYVSDGEAFNTARFFARRYGVLLGGSAGGVVFKALEELESREGTGNMVALVPDGGEKYISTIFNDTWMQEHELIKPHIEARLKILTTLKND